MVNWILMAGCLMVVIHFEKSSNMEAAYGMAIIVQYADDFTFARLLLSHTVHNFIFPFIGTLAMITIETIFLISNLDKFEHGGYFTFMIAIFIPRPSCSYCTMQIVSGKTC